MGKVKIFVDRNETVEGVEDSLLKAMEHHASGDVHENDDFPDPAMVDVKDRMMIAHEIIYRNILKEVFEALEEDFKQ